MLRKEQNDLLCQTGPGTPMGQMFRLSWQPALLAEELPDTPRIFSAKKSESGLRIGRRPFRDERGAKGAPAERVFEVFYVEINRRQIRRRAAVLLAEFLPFRDERTLRARERRQPERDRRQRRGMGSRSQHAGRRRERARGEKAGAAENGEKQGA